jgi:hypothetical protein
MFYNDDDNNSASDWAEEKIDQVKEGVQDGVDAVKADAEQTGRDIQNPELDELTENKMLGNEGDTSDGSN